MKNKPQKAETTQSTTRQHRKQVRLDKIARRYADRVRRGAKTVRYL